MTMRRGRQQQQQEYQHQHRTSSWTMMASMIFVTVTTWCSIIGYSDSYTLLSPPSLSMGIKSTTTTTTTQTMMMMMNRYRSSKRRSKNLINNHSNSVDRNNFVHLWQSTNDNESNYDDNSNEEKKEQLQQRRRAAKDYIKTTRPNLQQKRTTKKNKKEQMKPRNPLSSVTAASYQLLDHEILSKADEYELGIKIRKSVELQQKLDSIIERKKKEIVTEEHKHTKQQQRKQQQQDHHQPQNKKSKIRFQKRKVEEERQRDQRRRMMKIYSNGNIDDVVNEKYKNNNYVKHKNINNIPTIPPNRNLSFEEELEELLISRKVGGFSGGGGNDSADATDTRTPQRRRRITKNDNDWYGDMGDDIDDDDTIMMEELGVAIYGNNIDQDQHHEEEIGEDICYDEDGIIEDCYNQHYDDDDDQSNNMNMNINAFDDDENNADYDDGPTSSYLSYSSSSTTATRTRIAPSQIGYNLDEIRMYVTEKEIIHELGIEGGREELTSVLIHGALAKQKMIKSNIRLVTSIAKKWFRSAKNDGNSKMKGSQHSSYSGSWSVPALDEAIQQGIIGLAMAAERFEPERNFKFSTYATYYITNEVRKIFQSSITGCLYVPQHYFGIRNKYQYLVKEYFLETGQALDIQTAAHKLKLKIPRLQFVLKSTESLLQLDSPIALGESQGGKSGGNQGMAGGSNTFSDTLPCDDTTAESIIERSLLRQCIENALAAELSPHERDIVRLRHGLDDGVSRTVKQVRESCGGMLSLADIRTVEKRAYRKLRFPYSVHNARLREFAAEYAGVAPEMIETL